MRHLGILPSVLPAALWIIVVFLLLAVVVARTLAGFLGSSEWVAALIVAGFGLVVAITLTPLNAGASEAARTGILGSAGFLDVPMAWFREPDRLLNVLLFIPLGLGVGLVPRGRVRAAFVAGALLLPFVVEGLQYVVTVLHRDPQWQDVVDNLVGVLLGLALGWAIRRLGARPASEQM